MQVSRLKRFLNRSNKVDVVTESIVYYSFFIQELAVVRLMKKLAASMEPEDSLPCSQKPATEPYA
jgi:hypothetical protein